MPPRSSRCRLVRRRQKTAVEAASEDDRASKYEFSWVPAPRLRSQDGDFEISLHGRLLADGGYLDDRDRFYRSDGTTELRQARLGLQGRAWKDVTYSFQIDFADDGVDIEDAFVEYEGEVIHPAYVRVGQYKTPNSLEEETSLRFTTFMERAALIEAFDLDRRLGVGAGIAAGSWGIDGGLFGHHTEDGDPAEGFAAAGRAYYAFLDPIRAGSVLHLGTSVRFRDLDNDVDDRIAEYRRRPFFHFTDRRSVDTGKIPDATNDVWLGGEIALVLGPFSLQGEAAHTWLQRDGAENASGLWGGYLSASYFLTDEQRNYEGESGAFGRVKVNHSVFEGGPGAWEIGARLDYIALNDGGANIQGGEQYSLAAGINWYLSEHIRLMIEYAFTRVFNARNSPGAAASGSGNSINGVGARFQADF